MKEIEYKFLIDKKKWLELEKPEPQLIVQGFITKTKEKTVRVRIKNNQAFLTIKGPTKGITRTEFEYEIPLEDATALLEEFTDKQIRKNRYEIKIEHHTWEVDVFEGHLTGLIIAELEVESENELFILPDWTSENVSVDSRYYNSVLIDMNDKDVKNLINEN